MVLRDSLMKFEEEEGGEFHFRVGGKLGRRMGGVR